MIGRLKEPTVNRDGTMNLIVKVDVDFSSLYEELKDCDVEVEVKKRSKRRSLDANAFAWVLIDKIAAKMSLPPLEVYRNAIREIGGVSIFIGMKNEAVPVFKENWERGHLGRQVQVYSSGTKDGWSNVQVWYGSSEFDSAQMSRLIDSLIQDAEALGIPTISDAEAERLKANWRK